MVLTPVKSTKTYEVVAEQLRQAILDGTFASGSKLPSVRLLSQQFSVSQAAVREALSALQALRLVTMRQGEGTFVQSYDPAKLVHTLEDTARLHSTEIQSLLELRKVLETGVCHLAAIRCSTEQLQVLRNILGKMQADLASCELGEQTDWEFHYALVQASGNPYLVALMDAVAGEIQGALLASRQALYHLPDEPNRLLEQHHKIVQCIAEHDTKAAEQAMMEHLTHVENALHLPPPLRS